MKLIPLTQGKFAQVDDEDFEYLNQWKWFALKDAQTFYAARGIYLKGNILMHRQLLGLTNSEVKGEHKDRNGLNNQKENLRVATLQ